MNTTSLTILLVIVALIGLGALLYSFQLGRNRQYLRDENVSNARVRRSILLNPIFWAYILLPVAIILGVYLIYTVAW